MTIAPGVTPISVDGRLIGPGFPTWVIAELSGNHNGDVGRAVELIHAAADAGADAVKLQTYRADTITIDADGPWFEAGAGLWKGRRLYELYDEAHTPWEWFPTLVAVARERGVALFSTPFDASAVAFHAELDLPAEKIASFELLDHELVAAAAARGKPVLMSTGMASIAEIDAAVAVARSVGCGEIALLHCNSAYPAPPEEMDLRTIPHMAEAWNLPVGLSDHSLGIGASVAAVALGASVLERHLTLRRDEGGPDADFSLEPDELRALVAAVRVAEQALGGVRYGTGSTERESLAFRRSIFVVADIERGAELTRDNIRVIRPGHGLAPSELPRVLGRRTSSAILRGTPLSWDLLD